MLVVFDDCWRDEVDIGSGLMQWTEAVDRGSGHRQWTKAVDRGSGQTHNARTVICFCILCNDCVE